MRISNLMWTNLVYLFISDLLLMWFSYYLEFIVSTVFLVFFYLTTVVHLFIYWKTFTQAKSWKWNFPPVDRTVLSSQKIPSSPHIY